MSQLLASTIRGQKLGALSYVDGTSAPTHFSNGLPYENDGSVAVAVDGVIDHYHQGLPFTADGRLAVTLSGTPTRFGGGAAPFSASGQLVLGTDVNHYCGGVPFNATSAISSTADGPQPPTNERYFTQLDGQSKYWRRIEPDYGQTTNATLECLFYGGGSGAEYLVGVGGGDRFFIALNGNSVVFGNGASAGLGATSVDLEKINHAKLVADGANVTFFINGAQVAQVAQSWSGLLDNISFGLNGSSSAFYSGILVAARVTTDTVDNVYGLDTNLPYDLADGVTLGPELWEGTATSGSGWTDNGDGSYTCDGTGNALLVQGIPSTLESGNGVEVIFEVSGYVSGNVRALVYGASDVGIGSQRGSTGVFTEVVTVDATTSSAPNRAVMQGFGFAGTVSNISFKEIPNSALIFENGSIDGSDRLLVTKNAAIGFLGEDKWFDAIKSVTGQVTVPTPDSITIDEVGGTLAGVAIDTPAAPIRVTGACDLISGQVDISVIPALAGVAASITQSGPFSFDLVSQGALGFKRAFSGGAQAVLTNIKVELLYDYAAGAQPATSPYSPEYSSEYI